MDFTVIGLIAGALTSASFFPQVLKSWTTQKTEDISLLWTLILSVGLTIWLLYGLLIDDLALIIANSVASVEAYLMLIAKMKFG